VGVAARVGFTVGVRAGWVAEGAESKTLHALNQEQIVVKQMIV
jgi:hypothetical protein